MVTVEERGGVPESLTMIFVVADPPCGWWVSMASRDVARMVTMFSSGFSSAGENKIKHNFLSLSTNALETKTISTISRQFGESFKLKKHILPHETFKYARFVHIFKSKKSLVRCRRFYSVYQGVRYFIWCTYDASISDVFALWILLDSKKYS